MKTAVIFYPRKDGDYSGFVFSEERCQTAFLQFGYHFRGKYASVQRDLSVNAVVFKISIFFYELKSDLFQNMMASCI